MTKASLAVAEQAFNIESNCLAKAFSHIDVVSFSKAVDVLLSANKIAASGCGHTGIACMHFTHLMCCINRPARFLYPSEATHGALGYVQKEDVVLLASRGGETEELLPILRLCKEKGTSIIVVTENTKSILAEKADIVLKMFVNRETDRHNSQGTTSHAMLNALFDAIQASMIEELNYPVAEFAFVHPGGAVGKRLNIK
jgi:D-arabinose 5-phosphate isomerase GutQ